MERPKLNIKPAPIDRLIESLGIVALILLIGIPAYYFSELPDMIPRHYGIDGTPDSFSSKKVIWTLPIVGTILFVGLYWINKYPHKFNYTQKITKDNAEKQYKNVMRMIRILNSLIACILAYISFSTVKTALGKQSGLGLYFIPIFLLLIFTVIGYYLWASMKKTN